MDATLRSTLPFAFLMAALMHAAPAPAQGTAARLFGPTVAPAAVSTVVDRAAIRTRAVRPDLGAVDELARRHVATNEASRFTLDLFPGLELDAEVIAAEVRTTGTTVFAKLVGIELGTAVLTHEAGVLVATIDFPGGNFAVELDAGGDYRIVQKAAQFEPPEAPPRLHFAPAPTLDAFAEPDVPVDSGRLIDVMIVWTPAAQTAAGGAAAMQALAQASIDNANLTYLNSGVAQRVRLVHAQQVTYTEVASGPGCSDPFDCALDAITNGTVAGLHALRDTHGADLVSLFINSTTYCGLAWLPIPSAGTAHLGYSVLYWSGCPVSNKSFVHELGHNMGAHHDPYVAPGPGAYTYSHGMVNLAGRWRTVLAYNDQCAATTPFTSCTRVQYLSNPQLTYSGAPTGDAAVRNNAYTLNKTAKAIAAYRPTSSMHPVPQRFTDVAASHMFYGYMEFLAQAGITSGCGTGLYCPDSVVTRRQMAVFLERQLRASNWTPPAGTGLFIDVPPGAQFRDYIEALRNDAITSGCTTTTYCPDDPVTRAQMAVFVLRTMCGAAYVPSMPAVQRFTDVAPSHAFYRFIDKLAALGITSGCSVSPARYCPDDPVTRSQMAVFLERSFPAKVPTEACAL
ncbi:MAG: S-layer homology domain-containing protein [Betaproteobacteria bacterium]|nr:S-layer homology domain-containing protein [Betaproteobacteria bacterium]